MAKPLWCWGDIISPELADKALCAEEAREKGRAIRHANDEREAKPDPVAA